MLLNVLIISNSYLILISFKFQYEIRLCAIYWFLSFSSFPVSIFFFHVSFFFLFWSLLKAFCGMTTSIYSLGHEPGEWTDLKLSNLELLHLIFVASYLARLGVVFISDGFKCSSKQQSIQVLLLRVIFYFVIFIDDHLLNFQLSNQLWKCRKCRSKVYLSRQHFQCVVIQYFVCFCLYFVFQSWISCREDITV